MESLAADLREMTRTPLHQSHVETLKALGTEVSFEAGQMIAEAGDPMDQFIYIVEGRVEVIDPHTREAYLPTSLGPTQFLGEIAFLSGGVYSLPMRARESTRAISVPREKMLDAMSRIPEMSDIIITVFSARRRRQIEDNDSSLKLIGANLNRNIRQIEEFAIRNKIPFQTMDLGSEDASDVARSCHLTGHQPAVIFGDSLVVDDPTPAKVARLLGLEQSYDCREVIDVLIVGGGPAGVAAAVYAGAEGLSAIVVEDLAVGGVAVGEHDLRRIEGDDGAALKVHVLEMHLRAGPVAHHHSTCSHIPEVTGARCRRPRGRARGRGARPQPATDDAHELVKPRRSAGLVKQAGGASRTFSARLAHGTPDDSPEAQP